MSTFEQPREPSTGKLNRHLELAYNHVTSTWFPISEEVLTEIQHKISTDAYNSQPQELIADLKRDFSLFLYSIGQLVELVKSESGVLGIEPTNLLNENIELLKEKLRLVSPETICAQRLTDASDIQTQRIKFSAVSAGTAEVLSEQLVLDRDAAYSCAIFRQLGLTLIAWNYPHVYKRVITSLKENERLDDSLSRMLGFSPALLGITIARKWGLGPILRGGMGDPSDLAELPPEEADRIRAIGQTMAKVCEIGEALARASDPAHYPSASSDWKEAKSEILRHLGQSGIRKIKENIATHCQQYSKLMPDVFNLKFEHEAEPAQKGELGSALLSKNPYIKHCDREIQEQLLAIYARLDGQSISKENIDLLIKAIVPSAGFNRGCIYLIEPDSTKLVPRLAIESPLGSFSAVSYTAPSTEYHPVVSAFRCKTPIMEDNVVVEGRAVSYIAGALGDLQRAGVLYLEISDDLLKNRSSSILVCYKALRQTLADCLNLR